MDKDKKVIGIGLISGDEKGNFLAAVNKKERIEVKLVVAETLVALYAILWCQE